MVSDCLLGTDVGGGGSEECVQQGLVREFVVIVSEGLGMVSAEFTR